MVITLLTDFGHGDEYVGVMKGVILSILPSARIVDLSHEIEPWDITSAAYMISAAYPYFPERSIHVVVVDPGVGSSRQLLAVYSDGHFFIGPDNGVLTQIINSRSFDRACQIKNSNYYRSTISHTFHGRDILAPVAAHIASGVDIDRLGPAIGPAGLVHIPIHQPEILQNGSMEGYVITSDRFGNLITNISEDHLLSQFPLMTWPCLEIMIGKKRIRRIKNNYSQVPRKNLVAVVGGRRFLEISVNCGNAAELMKYKKGRSCFWVQCHLPDK